MTTVFAVTNQKGGVGKTTTSVNLGASLAATRKRVLLVDLDPQGNATMGSGVDKHALERHAGHVLMGDLDIADALTETRDAGYTLLPANAELTVAEVGLLSTSGREYRLRDALGAVCDRYDYVVIDCPPSLNMLTVNALVAARGVIIPMQCEYYALEGLSALMETIERVRSTANPGLRVAGLLRTMFDSRNRLANDVSQQLTTHFGERVFRTIIPRNVTLAEAPSHGLPVMLYDRTARGALAYLALAGEILRRESHPVVHSSSMSGGGTSGQSGR